MDHPFKDDFLSARAPREHGPEFALTDEQIQARMVESCRWLGIGLNEPTRSHRANDTAGNYAPNPVEFAETMARWGIGL